VYLVGVSGQDVSYEWHYMECEYTLDEECKIWTLL
jgi:hypothetical protein